MSNNKEEKKDALPEESQDELDTKMALLKKSHLHNDEQMDALHKQLETEYSSLSHNDMFGRVKGHIVNRFVKALEYRRQKLSIIQTFMEAELNAIEFDRDRVDKDLHGAVTRIHKRCKSLEGTYDLDNQVRHCHAIVDSVYVPGRMKQIAKDMVKLPGKIMGGAVSTTGKVLSAPLKVLSKSK